MKGTIVSGHRKITGVGYMQGGTLTAALVVDPEYPYPELAAAIKRAQGLVIPAPSIRGTNIRTVTLTPFELSSMPPGQYLVLGIIGEQPSREEFQAMLAKIFPNTSVSVTRAGSWDEIPATLQPIFKRAFFNHG